MKKFLVKFLCFFIPMKKQRTKFKKKLYNWLGSDVASAKHKNAKGNVLVSYMKDSIFLKDGDKNLLYHTNRWENREISRIFYELGYNVDCIDFNINFYPKKQYDVIFDIVDNLIKLKSCLKPKSLKILHLTGSYWKYNNEQEAQRMDDLEQRRGVRISAERVGTENDAAIEAADICTLVGNEHTLKTYPEAYRDKIQLINLTGSLLSKVKTNGEYYPEEKEFLWMGGAGAVHKGLDRLLEIFARHPEWTLNIMGKVNSEKEFVDLYRRELFELPNIKFHGLVKPSSDEFNQIASRCFAYINPSCAEATSTATVTAMQVGLYPIISIDNGFTLPDGAGIYLTECGMEEIEKAVETLWNKDKNQVEAEIKAVQKMTLENFSQANFRRQMKDFIEKQLTQFGV